MDTAIALSVIGLRIRQAGNITSLRCREVNLPWADYRVLTAMLQAPTSSCLLYDPGISNSSGHKVRMILGAGETRVQFPAPTLDHTQSAVTRLLGIFHLLLTSSGTYMHVMHVNTPILMPHTQNKKHTHTLTYMHTHTHREHKHMCVHTYTPIHAHTCTCECTHVFKVPPLRPSLYHDNFFLLRSERWILLKKKTVDGSWNIIGLDFKSVLWKVRNPFHKTCCKGTPTPRQLSSSAISSTPEREAVVADLYAMFSRWI